MKNLFKNIVTKYSDFLEITLLTLDSIENDSTFEIDFDSSYKNDIVNSKMTLGFSDIFMISCFPETWLMEKVEYTTDVFGKSLSIFHFLKNIESYHFTDYVYTLKDEQRIKIRNFIDSLENKKSYKEDPEIFKSNMKEISKYLSTLEA
jgi:hypothetical protein